MFRKREVRTLESPRYPSIPQHPLPPPYSPILLSVGNNSLRYVSTSPIPTFSCSHYSLESISWPQQLSILWITIITSSFWIWTLTWTFPFSFHFSVSSFSDNENNETISTPPVHLSVHVIPLYYSFLYLKQTNFSPLLQSSPPPSAALSSPDS